LGVPPAAGARLPVLGFDSDVVMVLNYVSQKKQLNVK
jgi:hypothetical protein